MPHLANIRRFGLAKEKRMEGCTRTGVFPNIPVRDSDEEFSDTGLFPPIRDVLYDVPCGFSEIERFREGIQRCGLQIPGSRRGPDQGAPRHVGRGRAEAEFSKV